MASVETKKRRFISLRIKLLVGFSLLFGVMFAGAFYWFYTFATRVAMERISQDMVDTLNAAVAGVDGDQFEAITREAVRRDDGYTDDARYWEQVEWLATVHDIEPRAFAYTYIPGDPDVAGQVRFVTSVGAVFEPPAGAPFLEPFQPLDVESMWQGFVTTTLYLKAYPDEYGYWVSSYAPIKNSQGEVVGALGVDFQAIYVQEVQRSIRNAVLPAFAIVYTLLFSLVFLVSHGITRPVITLTRAAERIGEGDYEQDLSSASKGATRDEIDTLAEVFQIMVGKVYQREQTLIRQVQELKIEIDEAKRQKQVSEIVDSDFFQDLQTKARSMRQRKPLTEERNP